MAEPVDPDATTSDTSESKDTILPENPAMPKASESIKVEQESPKEIPVKSPASSPEYDPYGTPKPHADNLIGILAPEVASASDARRPISPPKYDARGTIAKPKSQDDIHGYQVMKQKPKRDARMQPPSLMLGKRLPTGSLQPPPPASDLPAPSSPTAMEGSPKAHPMAGFPSPPSPTAAGPSNPGVASSSAPSANTFTKKTGWKSKLVFFASLWDQEDWPTCNSIIAKFQSDLTNHPANANQGWARTANRLVYHYQQGEWPKIETMLESMKKDHHFLRELTRTKNISQLHGHDGRRPDWFDI
jgi:hypothetical protein